MPQLPLSLGSIFFCHPVSGNEEQGSTTNISLWLKVASSSPLGWAPSCPWLLPLSHPHPYLISHHIWPAYHPDIFCHCLFFYTSPSIVTASTLVQVTEWL